MEPVSAIGLVGSVVGIVDVISRSILSLYDLRKRLKVADFTVTVLIGQFNTVRAALSQIQAWMNESLLDDSNHYQLLMDLESSLHSCRLLIGIIDSQISKLERNEDDVLKLESRVRVVLEDNATKECLNHLGHQVSALNLLLTAFKCRTPSDQKVLLEDKKSREVFDQVKNDSASLIVLYDASDVSSLRTNTTTATSKYSLRFIFDGEILKHKAYQSTFRALMRRAGGKRSSARHDQREEPADLGPVDESVQIDRPLYADKRRLKDEEEVLVLGLPGSGMSTIMEQIRRVHSYKHSGVELTEYRESILTYAASTIQKLCATIEAEGSDQGLSAEVHQHVQLINQFDQHLPMRQVPAELSAAVDAIWTTEETKKCLASFTKYPSAATYFLDSIQRITEPDYVPTEEDILRLPIDLIEGTGRIRESHIMSAWLRIRFIECYKSPTELMQRAHRFELVGSIVIVVDLASYDQVISDVVDGDVEIPSEDLASHDQVVSDVVDKITKMSENFALFEAVANSQFFRRSSIILLSSNFNAFKTKISRIPLENYFPDYTGGNDVHRAAKHILSRFSQLNHAQLDLSMHVTEACDAKTWAMVSAGIRDTAIQKTLKKLVL